MAEYIERERARNEFALYFQDSKKLVDECDLLICMLPTADVVEVRHGEWGKEKWSRTSQHVCSVCHLTSRVHPESVMYRYCPLCGAKMDGKDEG